MAPMFNNDVHLVHPLGTDLRGVQQKGVFGTGHVNTPEWKRATAESGTGLGSP
jgi:hypothetical protein